MAISEFVFIVTNHAMSMKHQFMVLNADDFKALREYQYDHRQPDKLYVCAIRPCNNGSAVITDIKNKLIGFTIDCLSMESIYQIKYEILLEIFNECVRFDLYKKIQRPSVLKPIVIDDFIVECQQKTECICDCIEINQRL